MWQDRKVGLLEIELLVSSEMLFFCIDLVIQKTFAMAEKISFSLRHPVKMIFLLYRVVACVFWEIKCCVCDIVLLCAK
jgi:hypothetical protein